MSRFWKPWSMLGALLAALVSQIAWAQLPTTQLTGVFPAGAKAGASAEVTISGADLDEAASLLFSHPGITAAPKMAAPLAPDKPAKPTPNQFTVTVAGDVPPGIYEVRTVGRFGVSNPRTFAINTLDEVAEANNNTVATAMEIKVPTVINGRADQNAKDYFKLPLKAGQRVLIDCLAERVDSRMDATLAIYNQSGRELARDRDTTGADPLLDFTAPADGTYLISVYDFVYGGGSDYVYRLVVHQAPRIDFVFPPAGTAGSQGPFTIYGRNLPGGQPAGISLDGVPLEKLAANIPVPGDPVARQRLAVGTYVLPRSGFLDNFEYRLAGPSGASNPVAIGIASDPVVLEQEPNSDAANPQKLTLPCEVAGQFYPARDRDWFTFDAKKGDVLTLEVLSHRLGLESDPALLVQRLTKNDKGEVTASDVATVDDPQERNNRIGGDFDTSTDDPSYRLVVNEDSTYRVLVRDNFGESRSDPRSMYRLIVRKEQPDFRAAVYLDPPNQQNNNNIAMLMGPVIRKGGTLELRVSLDRRDGFTGEVTVAVEGLPAGVTCPAAVIGGGVSTGSLVFTAADNVAAWSGPIRATAKATINGQEVAREVRMGTCVWGTQDRNQRPPEYRMTRDFVLSVMDKEMQPALVQVGEDKVYETALGGNLEIPVKVTRRDGFAEAIKLTKVNVPNEINIKEINVAGNAADAKLEMQLNQQNIKPGAYTFYLKGETKLKYARNPDAVKALEDEQKAFAEMQKQLADALTKANNDKTAATQAAQQAVNEKNQAEQNRNAGKTQSDQAAANAKTAQDKLTAAKDAAGKDAGNQALADAANAAQKAADDAAAQAKAAADKLAELEKALVAAMEKVKATEEAKQKADQTAKEAQDKVTAAGQEKQKLDQQLNEAKNKNQPKDVQFQMASTAVRVRIHPSPVKMSLGQTNVQLKQGDMAEVPVSVERLFGYDQPVEVYFDAPSGVSGFNVPKVDVPKDQNQGKLIVKTDKNTTPGEHTITIRVRSRWNNVQSDVTLPLVVKVDKVDAQ